MGRWRYNFRWRPRLWIFRFNFGNRGWTSTAFKLGWWTHNITSGRDTVNPPGPGSFSDGQTRRRGRARRNRPRR
jgi:hypothetical protein